MLSYVMFALNGFGVGLLVGRAIERRDWIDVVILWVVGITSLYFIIAAKV